MRHSRSDPGSRRTRDAQMRNYFESLLLGLCRRWLSAT